MDNTYRATSPTRVTQQNFEKKLNVHNRFPTYYFNTYDLRWLCASIHTYHYYLHYSRLQSQQPMIPALFSGQSRYRQPDNLSVNTLYFSGFKNIIYFESHTVYRACEIKCAVPCFTSWTNTPTYVCLFGLQVIRLPIGHEEYSFLFS